MSVQVEESIARIVEQGQDLCEAPTYSGLKAYREVIREVVGLYISQKYTHSERTEWSAFGKKNIYEALRKMDKILGELSEDIRTGKVGRTRINERQDRLYEQLEKVFK